MRARTRRLYTFGIAALLLLAAAVLAFFALRENANLFYTPEILAEKGQPEDGATMIFTVIDNSPHTIRVSYTGIAPDLFREGQGVVATGQFGPKGAFTARQILAKHDENYQPRELKPLDVAG